MTHDPMCPCQSHKQPHIQYLSGVCHYCQCDLIAKVREDTLDSVINLLEEMHSERVWWNDMLTWCISVNEAIYNIDNLRGKKEG
jgi:hypothetical protein